MFLCCLNICVNNISIEKNQIKLSGDLQLFEKTKNHTRNQKKDIIFLGDKKTYNLQVFKPSTNHRKKINRAVVFSRASFPNILNYRVPPMRPSKNLENKIPSDKY